jgi:hypothetical protein
MNLKSWIFMNDVCCAQGDPASVLASQIQSLVANPEMVSLKPDRSPLFQIAAHLDISGLPELPGPQTVAITEKIFARIREEALKAHAKRYSNRPMTPKGQTYTK